MAVVTALRPTRGGVAVDLDGVTWRTFPVAVVVEVRSRCRPGARSPAGARARPGAAPPPGEQVAVRALSRREHSRSVARHAARTRGVVDTVRADVLQRAERGGLVDDRAVRRASRTAARRAWRRRPADRRRPRATRSRRGGRAGCCLAPQPEAERAAAIVERRGRSARTLRYLAVTRVLRRLARAADCGYRERSATMSGLHPDFPANAQFRARLKP